MGSILAIFILVLLIVLAYYCGAHKKMSDEPYAYRPLSDHAEEGEDNPLSGPGGAFSDPPDTGEDGDTQRPLSGPPAEEGEDDDREEQPDV